MTRHRRPGPGVLHIRVGPRVTRLRGLGLVELADAAGVGIDWDAVDRAWWTRTDNVSDLLTNEEDVPLIDRTGGAASAVHRRPGPPPAAPDLLLFGDDDPSGDDAA